MSAVIYIPARDGLGGWSGELTYTNTIRILNGALRLSRGNDARGGDRFARYMPFDSSDGEMYAIFSTFPTGEHGVIGALAMRWREPSKRGGEPSGYTLSIIPDTSSPSGYSLWLENGKRKLSSHQIQYYQHGNSYCIRFSVVGDVIKGKLWPSADPEPGWQISISDSSVPAGPDRMSNGVFTYAKGSVEYSLITFAPKNDTAPSAEDISYKSRQGNPIDNGGGVAGTPGGFPAGGAYILQRPTVPRYYLSSNKATERLKVISPNLSFTPAPVYLHGTRVIERLRTSTATLSTSGPVYVLRGNIATERIRVKIQPTFTFTSPLPGQLSPSRLIERARISTPILTHIGPVYTLRPYRATERVNISSPTLTAHTVALMRPRGMNLRVGIGSPSVIFVPKPEVSALNPAPITLRLTITRTNDLLDPSVYNIEYKQYKPDYVDIKTYEGETLNIDRYRPDTIETGKIDSIELKTNRYRQIIIK